MISWKTLDTNQPVVVKDSPDKGRAFDAVVLIPEKFCYLRDKGIPIPNYNGDGVLWNNKKYYEILLAWNDPSEIVNDPEKDLFNYKYMEASGDIKYPIRIVTKEGFDRGCRYEDFDKPSPIDENHGMVYLDPS